MIPPLMLLVFGCTEAETDDVRWNPTSDSWWGPDTDTSVADTDTDPTGDTAPPPQTADTGFTTSVSCNGDGAASMDLGAGGRTTFVAYGPGDSVPIVSGPSSGKWGITLEVLTAGLDTSQAMSAVMRLDTARTDTTYIGVLLLQCPTPGPGWVSFHADFKNEDQTAAASGQFDGDDADISFTLTDHTDEFAEVDLTLELSGP